MFRPHFFRHWTSIDVKNIPTDLVNWWFYPNFDDHRYFPVAQKLEIWWNPFWLRLTSQDTWQTMSLIIKPNLSTSLWWLLPGFLKVVLCFQTQKEGRKWWFDVLGRRGFLQSIASFFVYFFLMYRNVICFDMCRNFCGPPQLHCV